ncbi:MAG: hypothetical protein ACTSV2_12875 [Candidatus Thorarchaeota archaeon]
MDSLHHQGLLVLETPDFIDFTITVRGSVTPLNSLQKEMAVAWVRKLGTPYVEDPIFIKNFMTDFSVALGIKPALSIDEVDFSQVIDFVESERAKKENMTKEEKKTLREARKVERERLKEIYGFALVDGEQMELGNYQTEPSGIFMGRGEHPLRGRWKKGATKKDITLNLSPDAELREEEADWGEIIWADDCMWVAKWTDELTGSSKYIWLHDATPIKQEREAAKFDKALKIEKNIDDIRAHIHEALSSDKPKRRAIAAACSLIDQLSLRVGDEKNPDEADTVGATTLRVEHLTFKNDYIVLDFLGKDSVAWHKEFHTTENVYTVFKELYDNASERLASFKSRRGKKSGADPKKVAQIFPTIRSTHVNKFLSEVIPGLTAKMFRTFHASIIIREELKQTKVKKTDPDFIKKAAVRRANLEVARVMNHTKQAPKGWPKTEQRYRLRIKNASDRIEKAKKVVLDKKKRLRSSKRTETSQLKSKQDAIKKQKEIITRNKESVTSWREKRDRAKTTLDNVRTRRQQIRGSKRKGQTTKKERMEDIQESVERTRKRYDDAEAGLVKARERYQKSKLSLEKKQAQFTEFKSKSTERIAKAQKTVNTYVERVKKAELAKKKIESDLALSKSSRTWNLGTSLKSYIHPKIIYRWCKKVEFDWRKIYPTTLQKKFSWIES